MLKKTKDILQILIQVKGINRKYTKLEEELVKGRKVTEDELVKFKEDVVEAELLLIKTRLQRNLASLTQDHMVCTFCIFIVRVKEFVERILSLYAILFK